ncbi:DUF397 domain-containing protein [Streptomyces sp. NPDC056188]|uniref:DUF397 domain-containing protein n=1 Tax=Streptomyces sp. NPDC056188 TaxID=3345740 RepID=UPI0035D7AC14
MNAAPTTERLVAANWLKSSYSAANNEYVEVAHAVTRVGIRDSKISARRELTVSTGAFAMFIEGLKDGITPSAC